MFGTMFVDPARCKEAFFNMGATERVHELKCWPPYFQEIVDQQKPFELRRKKDRDFRRGDLLLLREWRPDTTKGTAAEPPAEGAYTGRWTLVRVAQVYQDLPTMPDDLVAMSLTHVVQVED